MIKLRILRWDDYPGLSGGPKVINHKNPNKGKKEAELGRGLKDENALLLALKIEEGATNQGMHVASRSWTR